MFHHLYIDKATGALGYQADLIIDVGSYEDPSISPIIKGSSLNLRYMKLSQRERDALMRKKPAARLDWLAEPSNLRMLREEPTMNRPLATRT